MNVSSGILSILLQSYRLRCLSHALRFLQSVLHPQSQGLQLHHHESDLQVSRCARISTGAP